MDEAEPSSIGIPVAESRALWDEMTVLQVSVSYYFIRVCAFDCQHQQSPHQQSQTKELQPS